MKIVIITHGELGNGLLSSYSMIAGDSENIVSIPFDGDVNAFRGRLQNAFTLLKGEDILCLCDLFGGTPYNECLSLKLKNVFEGEIVCGVNLGMLLEVGVNSNQQWNILEMRNFAIEAGKQAIMGSGTEKVSNDIEF